MRSTAPRVPNLEAFSAREHTASVGPCGSRCQQAGSTVCAAARPAPGRWRYPRVRDVDPADVVVDAPRWCAKMHQTLSV